MAYTQKDEALEPLDRKQLRRALTVLAVVSLGILVLFSTAIYFFGFHQSEQTSARVFFAVFIAVIVIVLLYIYVQQSRKYKKDLAAGVKKVVTGKLTDKQKTLKRSGKNSHYTYFLLFDDLSVEVDKITFDKAQGGAEVRLEIAPASAKVLNLKTNNSEKEKSEPGTNVKAPAETLSAITESEAGYLAMRRKQNFRRWIRWSIFWFILFAFVGAMILVPLIVSGTSLSVITFTSALITLLFLLFRYWLYYRNIKQIDVDLKDGQKIILNVLVTEKIRSNVRMTGRHGNTSESGDFYYIAAGENFYEVSANDFANAKENHVCTLHIALKSKTVLQIQP